MTSAVDSNIFVITLVGNRLAGNSFASDGRVEDRLAQRAAGKKSEESNTEHAGG